MSDCLQSLCAYHIKNVTSLILLERSSDQDELLNLFIDLTTVINLINRKSLFDVTVRISRPSPSPFSLISCTLWLLSSLLHGFLSSNTTI